MNDAFYEGKIANKMRDQWIDTWKLILRRISFVVFSIIFLLADFEI